MTLNHPHSGPNDIRQQGLAVQPAKAAADRRWPGAVMILLILVAVGWPLVTMLAALAAYVLADRDQATVLAGVGVGMLLLRWMFAG